MDIVEYCWHLLWPEKVFATNVCSLHETALQSAVWLCFWFPASCCFICASLTVGLLFIGFVDIQASKWHCIKPPYTCLVDNIKSFEHNLERTSSGYNNMLTINMLNWRCVQYAPLAAGGIYLVVASDKENLLLKVLVQLFWTVLECFYSAVWLIEKIINTLLTMKIKVEALNNVCVAGWLLVKVSTGGLFPALWE